MPMTPEPRLDILGAALADPSRARILCELMDGRAFTNKELAAAAGITPQTASAHLTRLAAAGLITSLRSGRHVYHRIRDAAVARTLEALAGLSPTDHLYRNRRAGAEARAARACYNHLAGRLGVLIAERLAARGVLAPVEGALAPGPQLGAFLAATGIGAIPTRGRPLARPCLDWTERRTHLSGPLATAILHRALAAGWLERQSGTRALFPTTEGHAALERCFGITPAAWVGGEGGQFDR